MTGYDEAALVRVAGSMKKRASTTLREQTVTWPELPSPWWISTVMAAAA